MSEKRPRFVSLSNLQPYQLGIAELVLGLIAMGIGKSLGKSGEFEWSVVALGLTFYAVANPFMSIFKTKWMSNLLQSVLVYILLALGLLFSAKYLSDDPLNQHRAYQLIVAMSAMFFILITVISRVIKMLYDLAESGE